MPDQYSLRQSRTFWDVAIPSEHTPQACAARGRAAGVLPQGIQEVVLSVFYEHIRRLFGIHAATATAKTEINMI